MQGNYDVLDFGVAVCVCVCVRRAAKKSTMNVRQLDRAIYTHIHVKMYRAGGQQQRVKNARQFSFYFSPSKIIVNEWRAENLSLIMRGGN